MARDPPARLAVVARAIDNRPSLCDNPRGHSGARPSRATRQVTMFAKLKAALGRLAGGGGEATASGSNLPAVDYKGYRIKPAPYRSGGQFQTAGVIEKDFPDGTKEHRFIRAETHPGEDDAASFAVTKAKQIIDQQGDRIFG